MILFLIWSLTGRVSYRNECQPFHSFFQKVYTLVYSLFQMHPIIDLSRVASRAMSSHGIPTQNYRLLQAGIVILLHEFYPNIASHPDLQKRYIATEDVGDDATLLQWNPLFELSLLAEDESVADIMENLFYFVTSNSTIH